VQCDFAKLFCTIAQDGRGDWQAVAVAYLWQVERQDMQKLRERLSLDRNWRFALGHSASVALDFDYARSRCLIKAGEARGAAAFDFDDSKWRTVDLPHDWAVKLPFDSRGDKDLMDHGFRGIGPDHPESSIGWYRRTFTIPESDLGRRISVEFDGVFRDSIVWINGHQLGRHQSGYTSFRYDLTDCLNYGGRNVLVVRADASMFEGWWYEGAGIYRHVCLVKTDPLHVGHWGTFVTSEVRRAGSAQITVRTTVVNDSDERVRFRLKSCISELKSQIPGVRSQSYTTKPVMLDRWSSTEIVQKLIVKSPRLWSPDEPNLYQLRSELRKADKSGQSALADILDTTFGIRSLRWEATRGFFLNGKALKIKGTCNHQNHAGVGTAIPDRLQSLRIEKLKEMGSNAYRSSHYAATPELLEACDRLGMLVMAETRRAGSSPEVLGQLESMIRRDRNHPSIILWSIGNEEHTIQWSVAGERIGRSMVRLAHRLDPTRKVTAAMHDRGANEGFANIVDVHGWNYISVGDIEEFHRRNPKQPIVGSEEASTLGTRGIYADDASRGYVSAYDIRKPKWGSTAERWWTFFVERPWLAGGFVWTGFDYRGEPIPYKWPCTASHFGLMDLCGFAKDNYYYYKSWWTEEPVLHLFPHWNWTGREGQEIDVRVFSNMEEVELLLNGRSLGRREMRRNSHLAWNVFYEPGTLEAIGYRGGRTAAHKKIETTGPAARIVLTPDRKRIDADGEDVASVRVSVVDGSGRTVPTADDRICFEVTGRGRLIGVGNGDPSSHEADKASYRRLFNGLCLALVQSDFEPGSITVLARAEALAEARLTIPTRRARRRPAVP
jgi:beta-galactosidase